VCFNLSWKITDCLLMQKDNFLPQCDVATVKSKNTSVAKELSINALQVHYLYEKKCIQTFLVVFRYQFLESES
jgi:hypothetical protein